MSIRIEKQRPKVLGTKLSQFYLAKDYLDDAPRPPTLQDLQMP